MTPETAQWLRELVLQVTVPAAAPEAVAVAVAARRALEELDNILRGGGDE